ncbi:MAG TPA: glycolate oxidase subunit GlcF [Micromonosporaceae bacterium]
MTDAPPASDFGGAPGASEPGLGTAPPAAGLPESATPRTGAFDAFHPPERDLIDDCVHCGFCLPTCPTYSVWGEEMDSPRGRIYLMQQGLEGEPMTDSMVLHIDRCLGCMSCVTACPSGVQYNKLIEATRAQIERRYDRPASQRLLRNAIFAVFPYPRRLRALRGPLRLYQRSGLPKALRRSGILDRLPQTLRSMESLAPPLSTPTRLPRRIPARGTRRAVVGLLTGCVQSVFFSDVNAATARVLAAEGCDVVIPEGQGCCGALSVHNGREDEAARFARRTIDEFESAGVETVVVNAAGCGSSMKEYGHLLRDDPEYAQRAARFSARTRDVAEFLVELGPAAPRHPLPMRVAYHDACHLAHAQNIRSQPRQLLRGIPGLELLEIAEPEICCGSAGVYNLLQPEPARELGDRKLANILATDPDLLVTANPGCLMQVYAAAERRGRHLASAHTVMVLDASIRGLPPGALTGAPATPDEVTDVQAGPRSRR